MDATTHPYAAWEVTATGQILRTFPDEYLATQFALTHGTPPIPNPCDW